MNLPSPLSLAAAILALTAIGCASPSKLPDYEVPLTRDQQEALLKRAKPPQAYGVTIYATDEGPVFAGSARTYPRQRADAALKGDRHSTAPIIAVGGARADQPIHMLIDTTARESWITQKARTELGAMVIIAPQPIERGASHVYDPIGGWASIVPKLRIDDIHIENPIFFARNAIGPLATLARWERDDRLTGVIGFNLISVFNHVTFNFQSRIITFSTDTDARINPANILAEVPMDPNAKTLIINARILGEPMDILLDFAGDFEMVYDEAEDSELRQVSIGDLVFRQVSVVSGFEIGLGQESLPRIGRQLLERYVITLDNKNRRIIFERPRR